MVFPIEAAVGIVKRGKRMPAALGANFYVKHFHTRHVTVIKLNIQFEPDAAINVGIAYKADAIQWEAHK
jgi:hypothetical protein